jgi:hypothetical protein
MRVRAAFIAAVLGMIGVLTPAPSSALDKGSIGTISPEKTHLELDGTPMPGLYPGPGGRDPFAFFRPPACKTATYCDYVEFEVKYPENFLRDVFFGVNITLTWDNPYHETKNPTGNDLDMFLWGDDGPAAGGPSGDCGSPNDPAPGEPGARCDNIHPEVLTMTEPPNTTAEDANPAAIFITIVNHRGANTGYKLTADWFTFELPPPPKFTPPERETSRAPNTQVTGPFDFEVTTEQGDATPAPTPRKILVPGPDGKLHEVELPIYQAGQRLSSSAERSGTTTWIVAGIAGALALAAMLFLLVRRNRQAMDEL